MAVASRAVVVAATRQAFLEKEKRIAQGQLQEMPYAIFFCGEKGINAGQTRGLPYAGGELKFIVVVVCFGGECR